MTVICVMESYQLRASTLTALEHINKAHSLLSAETIVAMLYPAIASVVQSTLSYFNDYLTSIGTYACTVALCSVMEMVNIQLLHSRGVTDKDTYHRVYKNRDGTNTSMHYKLDISNLHSSVVFSLSKTKTRTPPFLSNFDLVFNY